MAATGSCYLLVLLVAVVAVVAAPTGASTLTVYETSGCGGGSETYERCGCHSIDFRAGYNFTFTDGLAADIYYSSGCGGDYEPRTLYQDEVRCGSFPYQSVFMCSGRHPLHMGRTPGSVTLSPPQLAS